MKKHIIKVLIIIILLLLKWQIAFAVSKSDFPGVLDRVYSHLTRAIYENYIKKGHHSIVFLPVVSRGDFETTISNNCNLVLIDRLNRLIKLSKESFIKDIDFEIKKGRFIRSNKKQTVFLEIELKYLEVKANSFDLKVLLKEISTAGKISIIKTLQYSGYDKDIQDYVVPKPKVSQIVWIFIGGIVLLTIMAIRFIIVGIIRFILRKRNYKPWSPLIRQENIPFWRMAMISLFLVFLFCILVYRIKIITIEDNAYFEGAEVHFFIDRNSGLFFNAGENNFKNITQGILRETCKKISNQILHPDTPELEKQGDLLTRLINWVLEKFGWERYRLREFADLKQSNYTYSIYTFSAGDIEQKKTGNLAELIVNYNPIIEDVLGRIDPELRHSSLIRPLAALYDKLVESDQETKRKKKFIIIFSDAAESFLDDVEDFIENVNRFYSHKDQYLRVFSVLFPNIPRVSSDDQIYPYEEGKLLLLSKISEFIVYINNIDRYTPEKLREVNDLFYERLEAYFQRNDLTESNYDRKLSEFKKLTSHMEDGKLLSIHEIAKLNFLKNHIAPDTLRRNKQNIGQPLYSDFFIYTFIGPGLYEEKKENLIHLEKLKYLDFRHRYVWSDVRDYDIARSQIFGQPINQEKMNEVINDIADTFVNQFIIIDKEADKESLIYKISLLIAVLATIFSLVYAVLLYWYKYDVNYRVEKKDYRINITTIVLILIILIAAFVYFRYENRWTIYGSSFWAFAVSAWFLFSYYYLPLILHWILRRKFQEYDMEDKTFAFDEVVWLKWLDRILFNILIAPLLTLSIFLQILSPAFKKGIRKINDPFISFMDTLFKDGLNLSDYNKFIEYFLILWMIVVGIYFIRAFIYSNTARTVYK